MFLKESKIYIQIYTVIMIFRRVQILHLFCADKLYFWEHVLSVKYRFCAKSLLYSILNTMCPKLYIFMFSLFYKSSENIFIAFLLLLPCCVYVFFSQFSYCCYRLYKVLLAKKSSIFDNYKLHTSTQNDSFVPLYPGSIKCSVFNSWARKVIATQCCCS